MFLRQHWYVAALCSELSERPIGRTILGEPVALYRNSSGRVVALADQCPHRGYPCPSAPSLTTYWSAAITDLPTTRRTLRRRSGTGPDSHETGRAHVPGRGKGLLAVDLDGPWRTR